MTTDDKDIDVENEHLHMIYDSYIYDVIQKLIQYGKKTSTAKFF